MLSNICLYKYGILIKLEFRKCVHYRLISAFLFWVKEIVKLQLLLFT